MELKKQVNLSNQQCIRTLCFLLPRPTKKLFSCKQKSYDPQRFLCKNFWNFCIDVVILTLTYNERLSCNLLWQMDLGEMQVKLRNLPFELCIFLDGTVYKWFFLFFATFDLLPFPSLKLCFKSRGDKQAVEVFKLNQAHFNPYSTSLFSAREGTQGTSQHCAILSSFSTSTIC